MNAVEEIEAAIEMLTGLRDKSTRGTWFWETPNLKDFPESDQSLLATDGSWETCEYFCTFSDSNTSRGESRRPGHEHLKTRPVLVGWGYDASGIVGTDHDRELIATLHRTIDAQLTILTGTLAIHAPMVAQGREAVWLSAVERAGDLALARAINGTPS